MAKSNITAHMIVKNEDQWVYYAITSVLPFVDEFLISDTGSTDQTIKIVRSIHSPKIHFSSLNITSRRGITQLRNQQLAQTKTKWAWIIDGDEIYPPQLVKEIIQATKKDYHGIAVRRYDLLGDIYHRQSEDVGQYQMLGTKGHLVTRLINKSAFPGLHVARPYPLEAYLDQRGRVIHTYSQKKWYITQSYLYHAMYLKRSSLGGNLSMFNRHKYKIELGIPVSTPYPPVFDLANPILPLNPKKKRSLNYFLLALLITPLKRLKRKLV